MSKVVNADAPQERYEAIGERIRTERERQGKSQTSVSIECGISNSTLSKIEYGTYPNLTYRNIWNISQCLNVSISYLLGETDCKVSNENISLYNLVKKVIKALLRILSSEERKELIKEFHFEKFE